MFRVYRANHGPNRGACDNGHSYEPLPVVIALFLFIFLVGEGDEEE